jgi:hypothetical protein
MTTLEPFPDEMALPPSLDFLNTLNCTSCEYNFHVTTFGKAKADTKHTCFCPQFSAVFDWHISLHFKLQASICCYFFGMSFSVCLCPTHFPWISLLLEGLVTLGPAKLKYLAVISNELNTMSRIDRRRAEVTLLNPHGEQIIQ